VPAWGVNALSCCWGGGSNDGSICVDDTTCGGGQCSPGGCVAEVAEAAANELTHDIYGSAVTVSSDSRTRRCQKAVSKAAGRLLVEHLKAFRVCKRDEFGTITNDADLVATCLEPQPDPKGKLADRALQISTDIQLKCLDKGVSSLGIEFPAPARRSQTPRSASASPSALPLLSRGELRRRDRAAARLRPSRRRRSKRELPGAVAAVDL
jgi:hypothetical protein